MTAEPKHQEPGEDAAAAGAAAPDRAASGAEKVAAAPRTGQMPLSAAEILTNELQSKVTQSGGVRRILRGFFTLAPMLIVGAIGWAIVRPVQVVAWGLPLSPAAVEVCAQIHWAGAALLAAGAAAVVLVVAPWTVGRLLAAGASYLLGLALVLFMLMNVAVAVVDGEWDVGLIALLLAALCGWAPSQAIGFATGELQRVQLRAMLAAGVAASQVGVDRPAGLGRWVGRFLLALPVLGTGIAVLLWLGSVRGRPAVRCVCLGAQAFLCYLEALVAVQVALTDWHGAVLGVYRPGGGGGPIDLDVVVAGPALWVLAAWCGLSAVLAGWAIASEVRASGAAGAEHNREAGK